MPPLQDIDFVQTYNDLYEYGRWVEFDVLFMKNNGYINATKLCKQAGKDFFVWKKTDGNQSLINEFEKHRKLCSLITIGNGENEFRGTYIHPDLISYLVHWCYYYFDSSSSRIIKKKKTTEGVVYVITTTCYQTKNIFKIGYTKNFEQRLTCLNMARTDEDEYFTVFMVASDKAHELEQQIHKELSDYRLSNKKELFSCSLEIIVDVIGQTGTKINHPTKQIQVKDEKIDELSEQIRTLMKISTDHIEKTDQVLGKLDETKEELEEAKDELSITNKTLEESHRTVQDIAKKLNISVEDRVPKIEEGKNSCLVIMKNNNEYYAIRRQKRTIKLGIKRYTDKFPNSVILKMIDYNPNCINLWNRVRDNLKEEGKITCTGSEFIITNSTEEQLKKDIDRIHNSRKNI